MSDWTIHRNGRDVWLEDEAGYVVPCDDDRREEPLYGYDEDDDDE